MPETVDDVVAFGKITFTPKEETYPMLPSFDALIFKEPEDNGIFTHTAVCIQLELDTCANSIEDAREKLMRVIGLYFNAQARTCNSLEEFAQKIVDISFDPSEQKKELSDIYQKVERNYLTSCIQKNRVQVPRIEPPDMVSSLFKNDMKLSPAIAI